MVAAIRSAAGASYKLLEAGLTRRVTLLASVPMMFEYQAVMTRPEHLATSGLTVDEEKQLRAPATALASRRGPQGGGK